MSKHITIESAESRLTDFTKLLDSIESIDAKTKQLWREIYVNAVTDRDNAYSMFVIIMKIMEDKSTEWAIHGKTAAAFIERMNKCNDQLIKLAELVNDAKQGDEAIDVESMYSKIK